MNPVFGLDEAIAPARRTHAGQTDKADRPYIEHTLRVMHRLRAQSASTRGVDDRASLFPGSFVVGGFLVGTPQEREHLVTDVALQVVILADLTGKPFV